MILAELKTIKIDNMTDVLHVPNHTELYPLGPPVILDKITGYE